MSEANAIEERAARYLMERCDPQWNAEREEELERWLAESLAHKATYWRLEYAWRQADRAIALPPLAPEHRPFFSRFTFPARYIAAAAMIPLAVSGAMFLWNSARLVKPVISYETRVGQHISVPLSDGSKIDLNTDTEIATLIDDRARQVDLAKGEAFFNVSHDAQRPFIVVAGKARITVLGTKFVVRRDGSAIKVSVLDGTVRLASNEHTTSAAILKKGSAAIVRGDYIMISEQDVDTILSNLMWRDGTLEFKSSRLDQVVGEFNRYRDRKIVIADPVLGQLKIGGSFKVDNTDGLIRLLKTAYGINVTETPDEIRLSRNM